MEQMNEGNVRFFVQDSPTSEADQNFDQFISPSRPKTLYQELNKPTESEKGRHTCARAQISKGTKPCTREQICGTTEQNEWAGERKPIKNSFSEIRDSWHAHAPRRRTRLRRH
jgi:hypothetical protein